MNVTSKASEIVSITIVASRLGVSGGGVKAHRRARRVDLRAGPDVQGAAVFQAGALPLAAAGRQGAQDGRQGWTVPP